MHQIIFLLAVPRSGSTVMELAFKNSGHFGLVLHEPNADCYYRKKRPDFPSMKTDKMDFLDYKAFKARLLEAAETGRVFVKDMIHHFYNDLVNDPDFAKQITFIFLVRDPLETIQSYLTKDPDVSEEEIGFEALSKFGDQLFAWGIQYQLVDYKDLVREPEMTLKTLCQGLSLPYHEGMSKVKADEEFKKQTEKFEIWHAEALSSSKIEPKHSKYQVDPNDSRVRVLLKHHQPFYEAIKNRQTYLRAPAVFAWQSKNESDYSTKDFFHPNLFHRK